MIDDIVEMVAPTVDQVVILGAGYDTRPYRLECLCRNTVFEVDHPDTQAAKVAAIPRTRDERSGRVSFVPVDFERDDLADSLCTAGFSTARASLFLWEGVTQYLSEQAVDATLATVACLGHSGSVLVFTYVDKAVIDGDIRRFPEAEKWLRGVQKRGEPWKFGISPASLSLFLNARGFELVEDVSTAEAGERYFGALGRHDRGSALYRIVTASVL
jgi:methyltransferase (TIGR00027 family)